MRARPAVLVDAHRGASATHPENTLAAFRAALEAGADSVELDLQLSWDGCPVVIHDPTVDRTTGGSGAVADLSLAELRGLDAGAFKHPRFSGERIPTLEEALAVLAAAPWVNLELKAPDPRLVEVAAEAVEEGQLHRRVMISSFHLPLLEAVKQRLPGVRTHLFVDRPLPADFWEGDGCHVDSLGVARRLVTARLLAELAATGRPVWAWTVDQPGEAVRLATAGVSVITTNDPATIGAALRSAGLR